MVGEGPEPRGTAAQPAALAAGLAYAHLRAILESANEAVVTTDEGQTILMANRAAMRIFGAEDLVGSPLDRLIPERHRAAHRQQMQQFALHGVGARHMGSHPTVAGLRADGSEFPLDATISLASVDGTLLFTAILRDMTEQQAAEQAALANRAKLDAALASMTDAVVITDAEGRFLEFNDAYVAFHRFPSRHECPTSRAESARFVAIYDDAGEPVEIDQRPVSRALHGETGAGVEYELLRRDTRERWVASYSFAPIRDERGEIVGSVVTGRDVTAWKQTRADLQASHAALQHLLAAQDRIQEEDRKRVARELHDDLAQMLVMIRMLLGLAGRALPADPSRAAALLEDAAGSATDAIGSTRRIINDLRPQTLEDFGLVEALRVHARAFARRTGISCEVRADGTAADPTHLDPDIATCLYGVAQEALTNAARHSGADRVHIDLFSADPDRLVLRVSDNGDGLSPGDRTKPGSFGLHRMEERVRAVNGELVVSAEREAGTTITATVPRVVEPAAAAAHAGPPVSGRP